MSSLILFHIWSDVSFRDYELYSAVSPLKKSFIRNLNKSPNFMNKIKTNHPWKELLGLLTNKSKYRKWIPQWLMLSFFFLFLPLIKYSFLLKVFA